VYSISRSLCMFADILDVFSTVYSCQYPLLLTICTNSLFLFFYHFIEYIIEGCRSFLRKLPYRYVSYIKNWVLHSSQIHFLNVWFMLNLRTQIIFFRLLSLFSEIKICYWTVGQKLDFFHGDRFYADSWQFHILIFW